MTARLRNEGEGLVKSETMPKGSIIHTMHRHDC